MSDSSYNCPVEVTLEVIGGKWKCVILWWLRRDAKRFGELKLLIPGIRQKILTQQLRELERDGLIRRQSYREVPPRVEYSLTPYGDTVRPITELMCTWGKTHKPEYQFGYLRLESLRLLVVVNDAVLSDRLCTILQVRGAQLITVTSTSAALEALRKAQFDALVVDIETLGEDSYTLICEVKDIEIEQGRQTPVIALTLSVLERERTIREGFQVHLAQPFEPEELIATLASLTRG